MTRLVLDLLDLNEPAPEVGDIVVTARLVREVVEVRPVDSLLWENRWRLELRRIGPRDPWPSFTPRVGARTHHVRGYQRGESAKDAARALGLPTEPAG